MFGKSNREKSGDNPDFLLCCDIKLLIINVLHNFFSAFALIRFVTFDIILLKLGKSTAFVLELNRPTKKSDFKGQLKYCKTKFYIFSGM